MDFSPFVSERQANVLYALAQEQYARTNKERPTKDEEQQNEDAINVGLAVYLAQRPRLAQLAALLKAANSTSDAVLAETKTLQVDERESREMGRFLNDLSDMLHARLGDIMCKRRSDDMELAAAEAGAA